MKNAKPENLIIYELMNYLIKESTNPEHWSLTVSSRSTHFKNGCFQYLDRLIYFISRQSRPTKERLKERREEIEKMAKSIAERTGRNNKEVLQVLLQILKEYI